jgi:hypothetical protein
VILPIAGTRAARSPGRWARVLALKESAAEQAGFRPGWLRKVCTFTSVFGEPDDFQGIASEENADERDLRGAHRGGKGRDPGARPVMRL